MFTYPRKLIAAISLASVLGLFSTAIVPQLSGESGQAQAAKKTKKKPVVRSRQS